MKILITTDLFTTATNGVVTSVRNLRDELKNKGHDVRILTLSDGKTSYKDEEDGVYYICSVSIGKIYPNVRMPMTYRHALIGELIDWKPDVIHSQCEFFSFQFALHISKSTGAPVIHTYHTLYEQYVTYVIPSKRLGECLVRVLSKKRLKRVRTVVVPTRKVEETLLKYGMKNDIQIVPSGISLKQHKERITSEERMRKRRELGIDDSKTVLLSLGRLGAEKKLDELLRLFAAARETNRNLVFLIVGDGPAREQLKALSAELDITDAVIFTGMVNPEKVQRYYALGDIFVSASTSETQGLTYIEAAANGLPLLCKQDLCLQDVVIPGENGYLYTDEREFLERMEAILRDPDWRESAKKRSEEIASAYDKETFGETMEAIYRSVIDG